MEQLLAKKEELNAIASRNQESQRARSKKYYDRGKETSDLTVGDQVLLRREQRKSSLDPKFDGPFPVISRRGPNLEIQRGSRRQWVHLNRCKGYEGSARLVIPPAGEKDSNGVEESLTTLGEETAEEQDDVAAEMVHDGMEPESEGIEQEELHTPSTRYPQSTRNPKKFYLDPVPWSEVPRSVLYPKPLQ